MPECTMHARARCTCKHDESEPRLAACAIFELGRRRRFRPVRAPESRLRETHTPQYQIPIDDSERMSEELSAVLSRMSTEFCATLIK